MHFHLGLAGILFLIITVLLFEVYGWGLIIWPAAVLAALALLWYTIRRLANRRERRRQQALAVQRRIIKLEAEQGIPLMTEGKCPNCGKPLIAGAHFCSYCKAPTPRMAHVCTVCGTRNAYDATWCGACGTPLEEEDAELTPRRKRHVSTFITTLLDSALQR